jgi:hypothetical protein
MPKTHTAQKAEILSSFTRPYPLPNDVINKNKYYSYSVNIKTQKIEKNLGLQRPESQLLLCRRRPAKC